MDMTFSEFEGKYGMKDGFTVRLKDKRGDVYWAVAFRPDVSDYRLRFTLAHELGHIMMDHIGTLHADEIEADFFASCLLAPRVVMEDLPADDVLAKRCGITKRQAFQARCRRAHTMPPLLQYHLRRWYAFELRRQAHRAEVLERRKEIEFRIRRDRQRYVSGEVARWRLQAEQAGLPQEEIDRYALEATKWGMEHIVRAPIREDAFKDVQGWKVKKARFVCVPAPRPRNAKQARVLRRLKAAEEDVFPARDIRPMEPINDGSDWEPFGVEDFVALVRRYDKYMEYSEHLPQKRPRGKKKSADAMEETQKNAAPADAAQSSQSQENQGPADITGAEKGESPEKT